MEREIFFDDGEYARRLAAVRHRMAARGVATLVTCHPGNICYLAGHFTVNLWDLMFLVVPAEGAPLLHVWQFERGRFQASGIGAELVCWQSGDEPVGIVARDLAARGLRGPFHVDIGSPYTPYAIVDRLIDALTAQRIEGVVESVRLVKTAAELAWLRLAGAITDRAVHAASELIRPGTADSAIAAAACAALVGGGSEFFCIDPIVCVGWRAGTPHSNRGGTVVAAGDPVFLELGATLARYTCPIMRTRVAGVVSPPLAELAAHSNACLDAMIDTLRPGATGHEVAAAGRRALAPILDRITFHHVYGYPIGIAFPPTWIENPGFLLIDGNHTPLEPGMVFHLPLMLRVLGQYGAGFSEAVEITQSGCRVFSAIPRSLTA